MPVTDTVYKSVGQFHKCWPQLEGGNSTGRQGPSLCPQHSPSGALCSSYEHECFKLIKSSRCFLGVSLSPLTHLRLSEWHLTSVSLTNSCEDWIVTAARQSQVTLPQDVFAPQFAPCVDLLLAACSLASKCSFTPGTRHASDLPQQRLHDLQY